MGDFLLYNSDGRITMWGQTTDGEENNQLSINEGDFILLEKYEENSYIDMETLEMKTRTEMPSIINKLTVYADGVDEIIISNLLNPTLVSLFEDNILVDSVYTIEDGVFEITFEDQGNYVIRLEAVPFLIKEYEITAI